MVVVLINVVNLQENLRKRYSKVKMQLASFLSANKTIRTM